jgi:hypothetical protein
MGVAVGLEGDAGRLHGHDLVGLEHPQAVRRRLVDPVDCEVGIGQRLSDQEHGGGQAEANQHWQRMLVQTGEPVIERQRQLLAGQYAGSRQPLQCSVKGHDVTAT